MADNVTVDNGTGTDYGVASDKITYSGDADQAVQLVKLVTVSGSEGSKTATDVTTGVQYVEDTAITANLGQGTLVVARRDDVLSALTPAEGDAVGLRVTGDGALWTQVAGGVVTVEDGSQFLMSGNIQHDDADLTTNPVKIGGRANAAAPASVAENDRTNAWFLLNGSQATTVTAAGALIGGDATNGLDVDVTRVTGTVTVGGGAAHASPVSGNPEVVAGRASNVIPTDVGADGDVASMWTNRHGAQVISQAPHVGLNSDPWNLLHEGVRYTSAQTSAVVVAGGASEKLVVTKVQIATEATTAGTAILYFGTGAFARGTNRACFDGNFIPSATNSPGVVLDGPFIAGTNGDDLMFTSVGAITIIINVWYYVVT